MEIPDGNISSLSTERKKTRCVATLLWQGKENVRNANSAQGSPRRNSITQTHTHTADSETIQVK